MFGRRRTSQPAAAAPVAIPAAGQPRARFVTVTTVQALPDTAAIARVDTLQATIGAGLSGRPAAGAVIGYDRGDPAHSLQTMVKARPGAVAEAIAAVYAYHEPPAPPEYQDALATNPRLDSFNSLLWARFAR